MSPGTDYRRAVVASQFHRARRRAAIESLVSRFSGQPANLLSFEEVVGKLGMSGQSSVGVRQIPVDRIVGSVARYQDFTRTFLPRLESDEDRWVSVGAAARSVSDLPPIDVYKVGESYFVLDGNHRVSLARQQQLQFIDARVIEVRTRAPLPEGTSPDNFIIAAEHGAFLVYTRLDILRPDCDMRVSVPGQFRHLESHIEAHRFVIETREERELPFEEAVMRWYDGVYLPMVHAIREQGILRYFPGRTETDFFIWLARHRADLENELGISIPPDVAVARLLSKVQEMANGDRATIAARLRRLTKLSPPETTGRAPQLTWAQERTLGRYSDHLFATVVFPFVVDEAGGKLAPDTDALDRAIAIAAAEGSQFTALCVIDHHEPTIAEEADIAELRQRVAQHNIPAEVVVEVGDPLRWMGDIGYLHDLVIVERTFNRQQAGDFTPTTSVGSIINTIHRPIMVLGESPGPAIPNSVLLIHDTRRSLDEAVFIGAYLAERWGVELTLLPLSNGRNTGEIVSRIDEYLGLHEVRATFLEPVRLNESAIANIIETASTGKFDMLVMTGPDRGRKINRSFQMMDMIWGVLQRWHHSALVAT